MHQRILVINVSRIGDTLLMTPALRALAAAYPGGRITCLAHPRRAEVLYHLPFIERVGAITKWRARLRGRFSAPHYDLAFVYGGDRALIRYALRVARRVVAFRQGEPALDAQLHHAVEPAAFQQDHSVHLALRLVQAAGIAPAGLGLAYEVTPPERAWAGAVLARRLPAHAKPVIGLQLASFPTKAYRDWPIEHFISLCERMLADFPQVFFLIFGGAAEHARTDMLHRRFKTRSALFAGKLSLRQTAALMERVDLYVGVDTGPTHLAGALRRPMVALYHCYSPSRLLAPLDHPAFHAVDHPRPEGCAPETPMAEISVEAVLARVREALAPLQLQAVPAPPGVAA